MVPARRGDFYATSLGLLSVLLLLTGFSACSRQNASPQPDPVARLQSVAVADPGKYPLLQEGKHWSNPYLVIRADNVGLLTDITANEEELLKPEKVLGTLAQLPATAWPYGRAVAVLMDEKHATSEQEKISVRRNRGIVEGDLESAHVAIRWIPD